jgi:hypothetical protein
MENQVHYYYVIFTQKKQQQQHYTPDQYNIPLPKTIL